MMASSNIVIKEEPDEESSSFAPLDADAFMDEYDMDLFKDEFDSDESDDEIRFAPRVSQQRIEEANVKQEEDEQSAINSGILSQISQPIDVIRSRP